MAQTEPVIQRSFAAGELAPALYARADQVKYATGARTVKNFLVRREGGVDNRPGTRYIATAKSAVTQTVLLKFLAGDENLVIEAGDLYFRFYKDGARLEVSGVGAWSGATAYVKGDLVVRNSINYYCILAHTNQQPPNATYWYPLSGAIYEIPTPYASASSLHLLQCVQSGYTMTITHPDHAPHELIRSASTRWTLAPVVTGPGIGPPTAGLAGVAGAAGALTRRYVITTAAAETYEESIASAVVTIANCAEPTEAAPNTVSWTAVTGAAEYYVYGDPYNNGTFGFLGTVTGGTTFRDVNFPPDYSVTPPIARSLFTGATTYPRACGLHQQRRLFGNSSTDPEGIWGSRVGFPGNFGISSPLQDDDAITFKIAGNKLNPVRHLIGLKQLVVLTDTGEWVIRGDAQGVLLPTAINPDQEGYVGASYVQPVVIGNTLIYVQARGSVVRDLRFDAEVEGLGGRDLTVAASHLFEGTTIFRLDYAQVPDSIVWAVRNDGTLLGLTYMPEHDVWGWHQHTTLDGQFEDVAVIPEDDRDAVYVLVDRTVDGVDVRYIERLETREEGEDAFFVDSGLTYDGVPADEFTGLDHLEGEVVAVLADGEVLFNGYPDQDEYEELADAFTVVNGTITLEEEYSVVQIGLPIQYADLETLDLDVHGTSLRGKRKRIQAMSVLVKDSAAGFLVGPDEDNLTPTRREQWEDPDPTTGLFDVNIAGSFTESGRVLIRHVDPVPLTILGVIPHMELGGG